MPAKKKHRGLPFVVQPRREPIIELLGTEESGQIEIKRLGYLTTAEKMYVQSTITADGSIASLQRLAIRISKETDTPVDQVLNELAEPLDYLKPYGAEIAEAMTMMVTYQEKLKVVAVAALLTLRVSDEITIDDVLSLHPDLTEEIYQLYQDEEVKSVAAFGDIKEEADPAAVESGK